MFVFVAVLAMAAEATAARKGTRNYQPDSNASMAPAATEQTGQALNAAGAEALDTCMSHWDPGTHMTKDEWRESCQRTIRDRAQKPGT